MNLAATHNTPATRTKAKPIAKVEFFDPESGQLVTRFVDLSNPPASRALSRLMIWATHKNVELRIRSSI